ncbi:DeoR/GlpR family DNA-binding transcription regulator [Candidatus Enterococcus murrayae]|uniref:DeoR/GlpR transcriptional regulator n=1 Tax=Candidatus Enterococcus murrayae TaxID=2815321 RepID=A0ABS3HM98_9ENTE|nr:DeoR/GlpR family DNA-binding transcription regulator [Enterococcus sp. MJM16]MBO0454581.1 DeoR/GlpR transcriptional regulator [Enterococcus sp. MJM16]
MKAAEIAQRRKEITELLYQTNEIKVQTLVKKFHVSDETIRKDLAYLAEEGILEKHHGKARLIREKELAPVLQRTSQFSEKDKITQAALNLITAEDYSIGLDQGSTLALLAKKIVPLEKKQLFTSSLAAISQLAIGQHKLFCFGGEYSPADMAFRNSGSEMFPDIQFDLCFFGSSGVINRKGFCTSSLIDAEAKRRMLKKSTKNIVLLDYTKFEKTSLVQVAPWSEIDIVITSKGLPLDYERMISAYAKLILV